MSGSPLDYVYDLAGNSPAQFAKNTSGAIYWWRGYVYLNGGLLGEYADSTTYFAHLDHLGSTRLMTRLDQSVFECDDYYPYGESIGCATGGMGGTFYKFTGDERDSETNLDHTWFRQYSSQLGRWMHPDPAGLAAVDPSNPQSWKRYSYVLNNPLSLIDPLGLDPNDGCTWDPDKQKLTCPPPPPEPDSPLNLLLATANSWCNEFMLNPRPCSRTDEENIRGNSSWWGTFGSTFVNGVLHGVRQPGESFAACVADNANQTTFGAHKAVMERSSRLRQPQSQMQAACKSQAVLRSRELRTLPSMPDDSCSWPQVASSLVRR